MDIAIGATVAVILLFLMQGAWLVVNDKQQDFIRRKHKNEIKSKEM